mgnify:FL=1
MIEVQKSKGNDIILSYYNTKELNIYKKYDIIHLEGIFHAIYFNKELYNLTVYDISNIDKVIEYIISNKYKSINFDFNHLHKPTIIKLLESNYNMPYIFTKSKIKLPVLNLLYNPKINKINILDIDYIFNEYNKKSSVCEGWATLNKNTIQTLKNKVFSNKMKGEISGKLEITNTFDEVDKIVFEVSHNILNNGDDSEVDSVVSMYNFHTHPKQSYYMTNTNLGWPSTDDFVIFIMAFIMDKISTYFHCVCAIEGVYILSIPKESVNKLLSLKTKNYNKLDKMLESYINEYINIDKRNFDYRKGKVVIRNNKKFNIDSVDSYVNYVDSVIPFEIDGMSVKLFNIEFFPWSGDLGLLGNKRIYFQFYYPKVEGNCILKEDQMRS